MNESRRMMGIDYGEARIGVALSDPLGLFARPYRIISHTNIHGDLALLRAIAEREQVTRIVIGLPTDSQGGIGPQAQTVIRWARKLAQVISLPIVFWDESFSSADALAIRQSRSKGKRGRPEPLDDVAAATILQDYLDAGGADHEPGQPLEAFSDIP
jgi:putative Holliday junction resolvase